MRWVFVLLALGACESRYGTYFNVDGDSQEIHFDRVELYFGTPTQRMAIGKPSGATTGPVYERQFEPSDTFAVPRPSDGSHPTQATYWLPYSADTAELKYVAAIAYDENNKPVGIGEVIDFKVEAGYVDTYDIELSPPAIGVDLWGPKPGCLAWTRQRDGAYSTVAVLPANDSDCDGLVASVDCNDLCPPDSRACSPDVSLCGSPDTCGFACASAGACAITTCMPDTACGSACALAVSIDARLGCAVDHTTNHIQINVNLGDSHPCVSEFLFSPYGRPCNNPRIEWADPRFGDDWKFQISNSGANCQLQMDSASQATFAGDHHLIVSFDPLPPATSRWSVIVGVEPGDPLCSTATGALNYSVLNPPPGVPYDCP